jgi:two-component system phosphate regulon sensor histidine kinase PhoR
MNRLLKRPNTLFYLIGLALAGLIGVQVYWIINSIRLQKTAVDRMLKEDIGIVAKQVEDEAYCFSFFSKAFVNKGEGMYIVKQKWEDGRYKGPGQGGYLDTLDLFNVFFMGKDTSFYKERTLWFENNPATVDVALKFTFIGQNPNIRRRDTSSYIINNLTPANYKDVLANKFKVDEAINMHLLDSLIKRTLRKSRLDTAYYAGIRQEGETGFEYLKPGTTPRHLESNTIKATFLESRFDKPYKLILYVPDSFNSAIRSMAVMMVSSFIIMVILVVAFAYFIRTIMKQRKLSEMKNTFINNITHEFRTPITNINLAIENWQDMPERSRSYLNIIAEENRHMEKNVEQILQLATIEHSNGHFHAFENVNIHTLAKETGETFRLQLDKINGRIDYNFNAQQPWVRGERSQLKNLLHNLIDNSIKYRSKDLHISIHTYDVGQQFVLQIKDNGIGMSAETQKHIFMQFYRGHCGDTHDVKGFGLGLSYVKHIVESHNGEIHVQSKPGKGTHFTIYFPKNLEQ